MGVVFRARDPRLDRDVAIKVLPEQLAQAPERLARFEREAKAVARLAHPNILEIHELGEHEGRPYMVTEVLDGETLRDRLEGGSLGWRKSAEIGASIADGLAAAHQAGIVHRDLKPSNIFLTSDGRVKVLDFGLARVDEAVDHEADTVSHSPDQTRAGTVLGTVGYMAPEQVKGHPADSRSDIFSLGCVMYEMVSGTRAFASDTTVETMNAILKQEPPEISPSGEPVPPELVGAVSRCLEKRPDARFQSASDLAYNLRTISGVRTPTGKVAVPGAGERRRKGLWFAIAAVAFIAAAVGLVVWAPWQGTPQEAEQQSEAPAETQWVAVAPLENRTGEASLDTIGQRAVDVITRRFSDIGQSAGLLTMEAVPYPPGKGAKGIGVPRDGSSAGSVGKKGPHTMLSDAYYLDGDQLELQARLTDYDTGELVYAFQPIVAPRSGAAQALDELQERVVAAMTIHWGRRGDVRVMTPPSSYDARLANGRASRHYYAGEYEEAMIACEKALKLDPGYFYAWEAMIRTLQTMGRHEEAARQLAAGEERFDNLTPFERSYLSALRAEARGNRPAQLSARRQMAQIAPHLNWVQYNVVLLAVQLNRPREALELAAKHPELWRGSWSLLLLQAHHALGDYEQQLGVPLRHRHRAPLGLPAVPGADRPEGLARSSQSECSASVPRDLPLEDRVCEEGTIIRSIHDEIWGLRIGEALVFLPIRFGHPGLPLSPQHFEQRNQGATDPAVERGLDGTDHRPRRGFGDARPVEPSQRSHEMGLRSLPLIDGGCRGGCGVQSRLEHWIPREQHLGRVSEDRHQSPRSHHPRQLPQPGHWLSNRSVSDAVHAPGPIEGTVVEGQSIHIPLLKRHPI